MSDDHGFIKEVIKEKPLDKKRLVKRCCGLLVAAVVFGIVAAFTFAYVLPYIQKDVEAKKQPDTVDIATDDEEVTVTPEATPEPQETEKIVEVPAELELNDYKQIYQDMKNASRDAQKSIVTVIGIKSEVDFFNDSYDSKGQLSGVLVANNSKELLILTEYRVVEGVDQIQVSFCNKATVDAQFLKYDPNTGLAILKVPLEAVDADTMDQILMAPLGNSYGVSQGEPVIALGSPMGYSDSIAFGVTTSITNKISTIDAEYSLLTTDILGSKEGSGILVNLDGQIVGMIAQNYSMDNNSVTALPISQIKQLVETLSNNQPILRIGIRGQVVTEEITAKRGIPQGICIDNLEPESPAALAGIFNGDVVVKIGEEEIKDWSDYQKQLDKCTPEQSVKITVMRAGGDGAYTEMVFDVTVQAL